MTATPHFPQARVNAAEAARDQSRAVALWLMRIGAGSLAACAIVALVLTVGIARTAQKATLGLPAVLEQAERMRGM